MEGLILVLLALVIILIVMPLIALVKARRATREIDQALARICELETRADTQQRRLQALENHITSPETEPAPCEPKPQTREPEPVPEPPPARLGPPPLPPQETLEPERPIPDYRPSPQIEGPTEPEAPSKPPFSLEQFLGVKMFAWLGGIALFFGVIFFVKYAFERDLISPAARVALGFVAGVGMLVGGLLIHRKENYRVLAQSLCATGVLILYGVSFAAHAVYRFPAFGPLATFTLMSLITAAAFLVAVRFNALVVAVLGILGGFLTPVLLPTAQDHPFALFSYIALLDAGLLAVTWRGRWSFLTIGAAVGTLLMQIGWVANHFVSGDYFAGARTLIPISVFLFFCGMFLAATWRSQDNKNNEQHLPAAAAILLVTAMGCAFFFLFFTSITDRVFLLYGYVLLINLGAIALSWIRPGFSMSPTIAGGATFIHLTIWTLNSLKPDLLGSALTAYLILGGLLAIWPVIAKRLRPGTATSQLRHIGAWTAPITLLLMLLPLFVLPEVSFILWPAVLLADLLVIGIALASSAMLPILASLVLTLLIATAWLFHVPAEIASLPPLLAVVVFFALLFAALSMLVGKSRCITAVGASSPWPASDTAKLLPAASCAMPFALLILMTLVLPIANPTPVFGAALLLAVLLLGLTVIIRTTLLAPIAVICCLALEGVWHVNRFDHLSSGIPLAWYLGFYTLFTAFPFIHRKLREDHTEPWIASALGGIGSFLLVHDLVRQSHPNSMMGLLPAAFSVPSVLSLLAVLRTVKTMDRPTQTRLSWLGGVALLFITLIFPIQFDRQWLTVSWALEGACLVWLFRRVPHPGLLWTGLVLLGVTFARLTFNSAVFTNYPRSGTPILNWHLYTYGIVALAQFLGAWWLPTDRRMLYKIDLSSIFWAFGGVLLFLLLNIEIADFFTAEGRHFIALDFSGNFARDMTYTIAWGLFALALLVIGIWRQNQGARLTSIALLGLTLLKLFLHDLANIENIYRIGALMATGLIAFIASFLYQRFFSRSSNP